jgi:hypothetical protein
VLGQANALASTLKLGQRGEVTTPNLASLMFLVEEGSQTLLLTGDGHAKDILDGLKHHGKWDNGQQIRVTCLKVQHHGSEHNLHGAFCEAVTADHYIFCGNGGHNNPDLRVVRCIVDSRRADADAFKLWFSSSEDFGGNATELAHMRSIRELCDELQGELGARMQTIFNSDPSVEVVF